MIDRKFIGLALPEFSARVEAGALRFFAKAIGQIDPIYVDEAAALEAGHPALPLPPTYLLSLQILQSSSAWRQQMGIVPQRVLHGEQSFVYHHMAYCGDTLRFLGRIADIYEKKDGALDFVARETQVFNQANVLVAELRSVLVHRNR